MDEYDDISAGFTILPGIDLALWLRIILVVLVVAALGAALGVALH